MRWPLGIHNTQTRFCHLTNFVPVGKLRNIFVCFLQYKRRKPIQLPHKSVERINYLMFAQHFEDVKNIVKLDTKEVSRGICVDFFPKLLFK